MTFKTKGSNEDKKNQENDLDHVRNFGQHLYNIKKDNQFHLFILALFFILIGFDVAYYKIDTSVVAVGLAFWILTLLAELYFIRKKFWHKRNLAVAMKIIPMGISMFLGVFCFNTAGISIICAIVFIIYYFEYIQLVDFANVVQKTTCILLASIVVVLITILNIVFCHLYDIEYSVFESCMFLLLVIFAIYNFTEITSRYVNTFISRISFLNNKISDTIEVNQELSLQQDKIKKAIDLLGVQKIELSQANATIKQQNLEMSAQNEILRIISSITNISESLKKVLQTIMRQETFSLICIDVEPLTFSGSKRQIILDCGTNDDLLKRVSSNVDRLIQQFIKGTKDTYIDNSVDVNRYPFLREYEVGSMLAIRLHNENVICGAIVFCAKARGAFTSELGFYQSLSAQVSIAINNSNLYATMENMAIRDGLTGIYNRRYFNKLFNDQITESMYNKESISVALFDIDKFKNVNDTYGHSFGDIVIITIAQIADRIVKANNGFFGRYGGEEFVMAFPNKTVDDVYPIVQQIHEEIKTTELDHAGEIVHVNVSIGITEYPKLCMNPAELLNHADWAMYYSKKTGRGKISIDSEKVREIAQN